MRRLTRQRVLGAVRMMVAGLVTTAAWGAVAEGESPSEQGTAAGSAQAATARPGRTDCKRTGVRECAGARDVHPDALSSRVPDRVGAGDEDGS